jgi:hypothetical protein
LALAVGFHELAQGRVLLDLEVDFNVLLQRGERLFEFVREASRKRRKRNARENEAIDVERRGGGVKHG